VTLAISQKYYFLNVLTAVPVDHSSAPFLFWRLATVSVLSVFAYCVRLSSLLTHFKSSTVGALDFQVRCMAAKTPNTARIGCLIGGCFTFFIGIPFAYLGAITR
jgi:hypothetical protein